MQAFNLISEKDCMKCRLLPNFSTGDFAMEVRLKAQVRAFAYHITELF